MSSHQPFRFLDLAKELRLTVYETIAITTTLHPFQVRQNTITLRIQSLPTALLATCRLVRDEASPILGRQIQEIASQTARLELPVGGLRALMNEPDLLEALLFGIRLVRGSDTAATWELVVDVILKMQSNLWGQSDGLEEMIRFIRQAAHCRVTKPLAGIEGSFFTPAFELRIHQTPLTLQNGFFTAPAFAIHGAIHKLDHLVKSDSNMDLVLHPSAGIISHQKAALLAWRLKIYRRENGFEPAPSVRATSDTDCQQQ